MVSQACGRGIRKPTNSRINTAQECLYSIGRSANQ
jgi:hypothetical protein